MDHHLGHHVPSPQGCSDHEAYPGLSGQILAVPAGSRQLGSCYRSCPVSAGIWWKIGAQSPFNEVQWNYVDQCALNLSRKHQPKPNLHTEVRRNGTEVLETYTDEYQTLVQGLIKGCREWYRPRKRGESIVLFIEVLGTKSKYLSLVLSEPEWNQNRQESWWNATRVSM
jgi:hypothetical protein